MPGGGERANDMKIWGKSISKEEGMHELWKSFTCLGTKKRLVGWGRVSEGKSAWPKFVGQGKDQMWVTPI